MTDQRPNIILFNPDQWRGDVLGYAGNAAARTPVLDRLTRNDAVAFTRTFCQNPVCTPSRCSFMTGWYPHVRGHRTMFHMLRPDEPVLLKTLKDSGYTVWWGGKNDLVPAQHSLEPYCDIYHKAPPGTLPPWAIDRQAEWRGEPGSDTYYSFLAGRLPLKDGASRYADSDWAHVQGAIDFIRSAPHERPFCLYLPLIYPHPPYAVEEPWYGLIDRAALPPRLLQPDWADKPAILKGIASRQRLETWDESRWSELRAVYYGMCARVDHQLGLLLDALQAAGLYDDTALFFFSDHGDFTGDYGLVEKTQNTFEDCLTRVPFLVKPPKGTAIRAGVRDALVELIDLPATVEELAGLPRRHTHFGRSLLPLITGAAQTHRDAVFCEGGRLHGETHCMELESDISKAPGDLYAPRLAWQRQEGPEHGKAVMARTAQYKYVRRLYETDELYDLRADPGEMHNCIADPALAPVLVQLQERLLTFYMETADVVPHDIDRR